MKNSSVKTLINYYRDDIKNHLNNYSYLKNEYETMQTKYNEQIEHNQKLYFNDYKIDKNQTRYILTCFQIITDAFIYKIDPVTGCRYLYK